MISMGYVVLKRGREISIYRRHPWVYSGAILKVVGSIEPGEIIRVLSNKGEFLGVGWYSPASQIRVRMLNFGDEESLGEDFLYKKIQRAISLREALIDVIDSSAYRLINSEGDTIPGVIVDRYSNFLVCQFLSAGAERFKDLIISCLREILKPEGIFERSDSNVRLKEGLKPYKGHLWGREAPDRVEIREKDVKFFVDVKRGHKSGFYLDQRENRYIFRDYVANKRILNCFSYTGGFCIHGFKKGAKEIKNIDASKDVLDAIEENLKLNGINKLSCENIKGNAFNILKEMYEKKEVFDVVVVDPPKFVHNMGQMKSGIRGYKKINSMAFRLVAEGGYVFTFSCSGLVDAELFKKIILESAIDAGRDVAVLKELSQGVDHPYSISFPEGRYLKGFLLRIL